MSSHKGEALKKAKKSIPEKYVKAIAESREYMGKMKEHKGDMKSMLRAYKK